MLSWLFPDPLPVGQDAPQFTLCDQDGGEVALAARRGEPTPKEVLAVAE
jgi:hypothetical protein